MTPRLDRFLYQWSIYKRALLVFFAVNIFSVVLSMVLGFEYFATQKDVRQVLQATTDKMARLDQTLDLINTIGKEGSQKTKWELRTKEDEARLVYELSRWQDLKSTLDYLPDVSFNREALSVVATPERQRELNSIREQLLKTKNQEWKTLQSQTERGHSKTQILIMVGLATLLFGLVLPIIIMYFMGRTLQGIRREMQSAALDFIRSWAEAKAGFGDEAFRNVEFWLQILLLLGERTSHLSSHPVVQITGEIAYLIRLELKKKSRPVDAA